MSNELHPEYLESQPRNSTEANNCTQLWGPIINTVFEHPDLKVMWGDSVNVRSSLAKKATHQSEETYKKYIGDKIDFRVCYKDRSTLVDVLNGEVSLGQADDKKYFSDHTKLSRETKTIADQFYTSKHVKEKEKRALKVRGIQLAGVEGEMIETRLVKNGLYVLSVLGSLRLPTCKDNLYRLRPLMKRFLEMKRGCLAISRTYRKMKESAKDHEINMPKKRHMERSPSNSDGERSPVAAFADDSSYINWVRGSWFPPTRYSTRTYDGSLPTFLLSPPRI
ncbi:hypothetical protein CLU79DRAFT_748609 [Phycomyces nitens]|nr:hypothetical protein CLU79DRAFT_748609 [Phycomyces nitens]